MAMLSNGISLAAWMLSTSESTVKSWASRHWNNDKKIQAARKRSKKSQLKGKKSRNQNAEKKSQKDAPKPRGAPHGNKNAAGNNGGAPKGSKNALKHGGYSVVDGTANMVVAQGASLDLSIAGGGYAHRFYHGGFGHDDHKQRQ